MPKLSFLFLLFLFISLKGQLSLEVWTTGPSVNILQTLIDVLMNTERGVQIMKPLIMQYSPFFCHVLPLGSRYSPQHPILAPPEFVLSVGRASFSGRFVSNVKLSIGLIIKNRAGWRSRSNALD